MSAARWLGIASVLLATTGLTAQVTVSRQKLPAEVVATRRTELERVLDAYIAGDYAIVGREIPRRPDAITRAALLDVIGDPHARWQPARVAFALELAVLSYRNNGLADALAFARLAVSMVAARPAPIGANAIDDRFEARAYDIVLGLMQGMGAWPMHDAAITAIAPRAAQLALLNPPVPSRFALARAINASMQCCRSRMSSSGLVVVFSGDSKSKTPVRPEDALTLFQAAADDPALKTEALIRAAYLDQLLGRGPTALTRLDRSAPIADPLLAYAAALIRGGVFDQLGQPDAAVGAYLAAQKIAPNAQVPAIGLAAALQRAGRTDEAVAEAVGARRLPVNGFDPWPAFGRADARFLDDWLRDMRTQLK